MTVTTVDAASAYEQITAGYPSWRITHAGDDPGRWVASHEDVVELVSAATVERLLDLLEDAELTRLQEAYKASWGVWRSQGGSWMATARIAGVEPTLMCDSPAELEVRMQNPSTWGQRAPYPRWPL